MTCQESLDYLYGLQTFGVKLGLENIRAFLSRLEHPERQYKTVLVAGTNGKGSVASALAGILTASGCRTGLYTSPHLHRFNERIRIDGEPIADDVIAAMVADLRPRGEGLPLTFFEFTTALALKYFAARQVDAAILEVGLGGRLDATNAVEPVLGVITPVAMDHQQHLGSDLTRIAAEKAGIMRPGVPVVLSRQRREAQRSLVGEAARCGAVVVSTPDDYDWVDRGESFDYDGPGISLDAVRPGIPGRHQFGNMATALAAAEILKRTGLPIGSPAMRQGVEQLVWPGRLEWMADRTVLLDGAHNGAGAAVLAQYLADRSIGNVHWIVGMKADKNCEEILAPIAPHAAALYCTEPPVETPLPVSTLATAATRFERPVVACASPGEALEKARHAAGKDGVVLVAGSLFLVAAIRERLLQEEKNRCATPAS